MLITYLLQVTLCLALFFAFYLLVLHKETMFRTNRIYLVSTLLVSLILPLIRIYILDLQRETIVTAPYIYVGSYLNAMGDAITVVPHDNGISWLNVVIGIYVSGVIIISFRIFRSIRTILKIRKNGEKMWISGKECILSKDVRSPFSFLTTIYMPADHTFNEVELTEIISHEQAHITGKHSLDVLFMELACIGIWPSPMIYLYRKMLREVHEFLADAAVLKDSPWENYAQFLVAQKANNLQNILSNQLIYSQLKNRLMMMTQRPSTFAARFKYLGIIPILFLSVIIFSFREKSISNPIYSDPAKDIFQNNANVNNVNALNANGPKTDTVFLEITRDLKYYVNHVLTPFSMLEKSILDASLNSISPYVFLYFDKSLTVGDLANVMSIGEKNHFRFVLQTPDSDPNRADSENKYNFQNTVVTSYRLTEPSKENDKSKGDYAVNDAYELPMPIFPGCEEVQISERGMCGTNKLIEYINNYLIYPETLKKANIEGNVIVKFTVGADGYVKNYSIEKSLHPDADQAVLNLFKNMNDSAGRWLPARKAGKSMDAEMTLPITFSLQKNIMNGNDEEPYSYVEQMPTFPNGVEAMYKFIYENIKYPATAREQGIAGQVIIQFVISKEGDIQNAKVLRGVGGGCSEEALRIVNDMPRWVPGKHDGKVVPVTFTLPIKFVLQEKDKNEIKPTINNNLLEIENHISVSISPNPSNTLVHIEIPVNVTSVSIFDSSGKLILNKQLNGNQNNTFQDVDVSKWTSGTYVAQLISGSKTYSTSFIVQH